MTSHWSNPVTLTIMTYKKQTRITVTLTIMTYKKQTRINPKKEVETTELKRNKVSLSIAKLVTYICT